MAIAFSSSAHSQGNYFHNRYATECDRSTKVMMSNSGSLFSASFGSTDGFVTIAIAFTKIDVNGNSIWSTTYQLPTCTSVNIEAVIQTTDSGFVTLLNTNIPFDTVGYGMFSVIKVDKHGNFVFTKSYYLTTTNGGYGLASKPNNGFIISGGGCQGQSYLFNCDETGNVIWKKQFIQFINGQGSHVADKIVLCNDGNYVVAGNSGNYSYIFKIDTSGNYIWHKYFYIAQSTINQKLIETPDHGFAILGLSISPHNGSSFIYKTNTAGDMQWCKYSLSSQYAYAAVQYADLTVDSADNLFLTGEEFSDSANNFMMTLDLSGNLLSSVINNFSMMSFYIESTSYAGNGQFIISGHDFTGANYVRIDQDGYPICGFHDTTIIMSNIFAISQMDSALISPLENFRCDSLLSLVALNVENKKDSISCIHIDVPTIEDEKIPIQIFPNPSINALYIKRNQPSGGKFSLAFQNILGERIIAQQIEMGDAIKVDIGNFARGIYFVIIQDDKNCIQKKFVKE